MRSRIIAENNENLCIIKKQLLGKTEKYLLKLNRGARQLEIFNRVTNEVIREYHSIRDDFDLIEYAMFEKVKSFPCIYGTEKTPTPNGIFTVEYKSKDAYISEYHHEYERVKFFGYLVIFEDYFIHSNMYLIDVNEEDMRRGRGKTVSIGDEATAGCIRVSQENLDWLLENIDIETIVIL